MFYRQYREKKQANIRLAEQNEEINTQNEEIMTQRDEISTQRDSVTKQKEHIEKIHHELTDSINYAQRIQEAMLPKELTDLFPEHFVIFLPKDIVSGDFYWTTMITNEHTSLRIVAVADCTGHGVPGAFMSMLGISGLKEIVINKKIIRPDLILNHLRDYIIDSLQQRSLAGEINTNIIQDGMDMTICAIDLDKMEMEFAGAYNPIYYIHNNQLTEYKSDKMPIGYFVIMNPYNLQKIKIQKDDIVYLMSDGFKDQFGGEFRKKLKAKTLKKMLTNFSNLNMDSQKKNIIEALNNWKSINEQVDDITLIGIKI